MIIQNISFIAWLWHHADDKERSQFHGKYARVYGNIELVNNVYTLSMEGSRLNICTDNSYSSINKITIGSTIEIYGHVESSASSITINMIYFREVTIPLKIMEKTYKIKQQVYMKCKEGEIKNSTLNITKKY